MISQHRSGSTLLQRVLGGHSRIVTGAETFLMLHPLYALKREGFRAEYREWEARVAVADFLEHHAGGEETYVEALRAMAGVLYGAALEGTGARYFLDKTPRYTTIIPELHRVLPDARFVFLLRNPLAVLASQLEGFERPTTFQALTFVRNETILAPPRLLAGIDLLGDAAIVVRYEDLVTEPERTVAGLCAAIDLDFEPGMIEYGDRPDPPGRGRFFDQRGIPRHRRPSPGSLDKWRSLGDDPQRRHVARSFLFELGPETVGRLGYSFDELLAVVDAPAHAPGAAGIVGPWDALVAPAPALDEYLDAYPGVADFPASPLRREQPVTPARVSVIVPALGDAVGVDRALRSVLVQSRPNVELIVVPDGSAAADRVVARYAPWDTVVTDPVPGTYWAAVERGLAVSTGEVLTWLRPDEAHLPWTLAVAGEVFAARRDVEWMIGDQHLVLDAAGRAVGHEVAPADFGAWLAAPELAMPLRGAFVRRTLWHRAGAHLDLTLVEAADHELGARLSARATLVLAPTALVGVHPGNPWIAARYADEVREYLESDDAVPFADGPFARLRHHAPSGRWRFVGPPPVAS